MYAVVLVPLLSGGWRLLGGESRRNAWRGRMLSPLRWARLLLVAWGAPRCCLPGDGWALPVFYAWLRAWFVRATR